MRSSRILLGLLIIQLAACAPQKTSVKILNSGTPSLPSTNSTEVDVPTESSRITVAAVGDILIHTAVKQSAEAAGKNGYQTLFADVTDDLKKADLTFANLETPVAPKTGNTQKPFVFNASPDVVSALKQIGVDVVSVANNHIYDQGRTGLVETMQQLEKLGMPYIGIGPNKTSARKPRLFDFKEIRLALIGYSELFNSDLTPSQNNEPLANKLNADEVMADIKAARAQADFVIVSIHWGIEYEAAPTNKAENLAKKFFEAGADVILGHHPHVLQPIQAYKASDGRPCFVVYSLGNFISNQSRSYLADVTPDAVGDTRDSVILYFDIVKRHYGKAGSRAELSKVRYIPVWGENDELTRKPGNAPVIRAISINKTIEQLTQQRNSLSDNENSTFMELSSRIKALKLRRSKIAERMGHDYMVVSPQ